MPASSRARIPALTVVAAAAALVLLPALPAVADTADDIVVGTFTSPRAVIFSPDGDTLYVADEATGRLGVVDLVTGTSIDYATAIGAFDGYLAISSDGRYVYSSDTGNWLINVFDTVTHTSTSISAQFPAGLALSPDDSTLYVASILNARVDSYDTATGAPLASYPTGSFPIAVALSADGSRLWVANSGSNYVTTYPTADPADQTDIPVGGIQQGLALSPDGSTVWVATSGSNDLVALDTATLSVGAPISIAPNAPWDVAVHPDGRRLFVVDRTTDEIVVVDAVARTVAATVPAGDEPWRIAVAADGSRVAAANYFSAFATLYTRPSVSIDGAADRTGDPGTTLTLSAITNGAGTYDGLQWQVDTGAGFVDVPTATGLTLDVTVGDATRYRLSVRSAVFGEILSPVVTVTHALPATGADVTGTLVVGAALIVAGATLFRGRRVASGR